MIEPQQDPLTSLPNRHALQEFLHSQERSSSGLAAISLKISRFGRVNNSFGTELGDKVISMTAKRLIKLFPDAKLISRTHGDHFCLVFGSDDAVDSVLEQLEDFTQRPLAVRGEVIVLAIRTGIATSSCCNSDPSRLLYASELALHHAEHAGLKSSIFQAEMEEESRQAHHLENDLRLSMANRHFDLHRALSNDEFMLVYQPIVDTETGAAMAMEALVRWQHPSKGLVPPSQFILMAEQAELMDLLGMWILRRAILACSTWSAGRDGRRVGVSINVSPVQFGQPKLVINAIRQALEETGLDPSLIKIEITETSAMVENMLAALEEIRLMGCKISLDDFGTGYSSLTQLNRLPLDYLKLDQSFITNLDSSDAAAHQRSTRMISAVLSIADAFNLESILEGVETDSQLKQVKNLGARYVQGYLFSRPLDETGVADFIAQQKGG